MWVAANKKETSYYMYPYLNKASNLLVRPTPSNADQRLRITAAYHMKFDVPLVADPDPQAMSMTIMLLLYDE